MLLRNYLPPLKLGAKVLPSEVMGFGGMTTGNVYYVIKKTEAHYAKFVKDFQCTYSDGSKSVCVDVGTSTGSGFAVNSAVALLNTGIQDALNKCVSNRNDYVIIMPSQDDYDIGAALTITKKCVHLICPAGLGNDVGATNACRIHQNTAATAVIAVSNSSIEIAGLYLKSYQNRSHITLATASYGLNIHNNSLMMNVDSTGAEAMIAGSGDAGAWGSIERNWIVSQAGNGATIAAIISIGASATAARVNRNEITIGDGNTATIGISNAAVKGRTDFNTFGTGGGSDGGTFVHCISIGASGSAIGNRGTVADSVLVVGGTNQASYSDNMNGVNGGLVDDQT